MNSPAQNKDFDPGGVGLKNGNFIGLPFTPENARVIFIPVPWDVTASSHAGTAGGPQAILDASVQLDLFDPEVKDAWKVGIFMQPPDERLWAKSKQWRVKAARVIDFLENGGSLFRNPVMAREVEEINKACRQMNDWVYMMSKKRLDAGKVVGIVGGDHSVPLGYLKALGEKYSDFGVLQIDAHFDLRESYQGFTYSHASVFFNALKHSSISRLVPVAIRDFCEEEVARAETSGERVSFFPDQHLKENRFQGMTWNDQCAMIISKLPADVYVSIDVDGLDPSLCPQTGTPVPGGLLFQETLYLLKKVVESGRKIIGFDVCETGNKEWDANVASRLLYKLSILAVKSQNLVGDAS